MVWQTILQWTLTMFSKIAEFGEWLFKPITFVDVVMNSVPALIFKGVTNNGTTFNGWDWNRVVDVFGRIVEDKVPWLNTITFTPIALISTSALAIVVLVGVLDKLNVFN